MKTEHKNPIKLDSPDEAIEAIKNGEIIIVVDDEDRENEGDFITSSELITTEKVNFMAKYGRGLICASVPEKRCDELDLELMVGKGNNTSLHETPFTISVDLIGKGCTTGISASDRAKTIKALVEDDTKAEDLGRPGHIFPLKAKEQGVLRRAGHTEATLDLTRIAGLKPGGALVEIMNEDGSMARLPQLMEVAKRFDLKIISIKALIEYRLRTESSIERGEKVKMPTEYGKFDLIPYRQLSNGIEHSALIKGTWTEDEPVLVRVHSSCVTGDIFGSKRCDCGDQLHLAMEKVDKNGSGIVLYMDQEGRGIGYFNKIKTYKLQEEGYDTVEANHKLGFKDDERDYGVGAQILRDLGVRKIILMTNNPVKRAGLEGYGLEIIKTVPIEVEYNKHNHFYMKTKKIKMGHDLHKI